MTDRAPECSKCSRTMEPGFVLEQTHGGLAQSSWVDGVPERSVWTRLKLTGHQRVVVTTFRCPPCRGVESYAPLA